MASRCTTSDSASAKSDSITSSMPTIPLLHESELLARALLDRRRAEPGERAEHGALGLGDLGVIRGVGEHVLRLRRVVQEILRDVLLVEVRRGAHRARSAGWR